MTVTVTNKNIGELALQASQRQEAHDSMVSPSTRKQTGHFGTPAAIAAYMASMVKLPSKSIRILDPGAGVGTLAAAICDRISDLRSPRNVYLELWENDSSLYSHLDDTASKIKASLENLGHSVHVSIMKGDFILENDIALLTKKSSGGFNVAIMNPPYFKLRKESGHAKAMAHVVHGQPNIYAFFMAKGIELLADHGELVAITPRSYFNGPYFTKFRKWSLDRVTLKRIHLFDSRKDAFRNDDVLQENVILVARKEPEVSKLSRSVSPSASKGGLQEPPDSSVIVTSSFGRNVNLEATHRELLQSQVVAGPDKVIRVTTNDFDQVLIDAIEQLPQRFSELEIEVSTGPVVTFRATDFLLTQRDGDKSSPLLMMHNVRPFTTVIGTKNGKPSHIKKCDKSRSILLPANQYVLLKRFTSKEEKRRLVAGIFRREDSYSEWVGIENHVNYIHKKGDGLTDSEAFGLASLLNSYALDRYLRAISGNTQVNAAEIRGLCLPNMETIRSLGLAVQLLPDRQSKQVESLVAEALNLSGKITAALIKEA